MRNIIISAVILLALTAIYLIIRFRKVGIISAIAMIGYIALYLLVVRFTDTVLSLESMAAVGIAAVVQLMFLQEIAKRIKQGVANIDATVKEELIKNIQVQIPLYIMAIVFVFTNWETVISFGTSLFWGLIIWAVYNYIFTRLMFMQIENKNK